MFNTILFNGGLFNQIQEETLELYLSPIAYSDNTLSFILSEETLTIQYLECDNYSGESQKVLDFIIDPYYYHSNPNNNFTFFCEYNAPVGEVNFVFPDAPCSSFAYFETRSGEAAKILELLTADWLPFSYSGEELDVIFLTFKILPLNEAASGEHTALSTILTSKILTPIGYSGEYGEFDSFYIPPRAEFSIDGYSDENAILFDLSASYALYPSEYSTGESNLAVLTQADYGAYILTEGPSAYWKFDEQTGTSAIDSTGNNSAATINGPTLANASPVASRYSFYFDGVNDLVTGPPTSIVSANLTQELWVKPDAGATITLYTPSTSGVQGGTGQRYAVWPYNNGSGSGGGISVGSNGIQVVAHGSAYLPILLSYQQPISTTQYTHILVSWNDRTPTLYVDGVAVATGYQARAPFASQGLPRDGTYGYYKGYMQDVAIYPSALTAAQAREHYLAGIGLHYIPRFEPIPAYSGETLEQIDFTIDLTPLGYIRNYTGERAESFALITSSVLSLPFYSGENNLLSFTTFPSPELTLPFYSGENSLLAFATVDLIDGKAYTGEYSTSALATFIASTITPIFYPGTTAEAILRTVDSLVPKAYSGENTAADLIAYPAIPLSPSAYSGENAFAALLPGITLPSIAYSGSYGAFDLAYTVNTGMPAGWYDGESVDLTLSTNSALPFIGYAGENVLLYFGASFALYSDAYSGTYALASLTLNPFDQIDSAGYSGQVISPTLSTTTRLPNIGYSGENTYFDLYQSLQPNVLAIGYSGVVAVSDLQISFQLPIGRAYTGTSAVVNQMDSEPNIRSYADETFATSLSTTDVFKTTAMGTGENCLVGFQVGKSEGLGSFDIYSGIALLTTFDTKHHADLYVMFRTSIMTQVDIGSATYFDLNTDTCCGVRRESTSNNLMMHLFVRDYLPEAISDGDRVVFSVDLRCNPRFQVEFGTGQNFLFKEYDGYLSINFADGTESILNQFDVDLTHKLCKGYFIPNGNWMVVEMNDVLPEDCYADVFYSGTTLSCILSDDIVIRISDNYCGEALTPSLTTFPPWEFIFRTGETMLFTLSLEVAMFPSGRTGEYLQFRLYEEPFRCYTGATGECEISIEYHVRFKETGCFDNDFTFQNEDGDSIAELSNPVPVEGEPFYHSVLAECM